MDHRYYVRLLGWAVLLFAFGFALSIMAPPFRVI